MASKLVSLDEAYDLIRNRLPEWLEEKGYKKEKKSRTGFFIKSVFNPDDKDPSMHIYKRIDGTWGYNCFSKHKSGDIFTLNNVMDGKPLFGQGFITDNVVPLGKKYGIEIDIKPLTKEQVDMINIRSAYSIVASTISSNILYGEISEGVEAYIKERKYSKADFAEYSIGYVQNWDDFKSDLLSKGLTEEYLEEVGIAKYIFNSNNLIFAQHDQHGGTIAFAARNCYFNKEDKTASKYYNSRETILYRKREVLYNLHKAIKKNGGMGSLYLCEGHTDAIALDRAGFRAAALGGTAFCIEHISLLLNTKQSDIVLVLDGDSSGIESTAKAITETMKGIRNFRSRIVTLPDGLDPEAFLRKYSEEEFLKLSHLSAFEYQMRYLQSISDLDGYELAEQAIPLIINESSEIQKEKMCKNLSEISGVPLDTIRKEVSNLYEKEVIALNAEKETVVDATVKDLRVNPDEALNILQKAVYSIEDIENKYSSNKYSESEYFEAIEAIEYQNEDEPENDLIKVSRMPIFTDNHAGSTKGKLMLLGGQPNAGKCIEENALILLPNGERKKIKDVVRDKDDVITYDETTGKLRPGKVSDYYDNGIKPVYQVTTKSGRQVKTTDNHPFLTIDGWKELKDIKIGEGIAVPCNYQDAIKREMVIPSSLYAESDVNRFRIDRTINDLLTCGIVPYVSTNLTKSTKKKSIWELEGWVKCAEVSHQGTDIMFDPIIDVTYYGDCQTYDLTVPGTHNFVADNVLVHNTGWLVSFAVNSLLSGKYDEVYNYPEVDEEKTNLCIIFHTVDDTREELVSKIAANIGSGYSKESSINYMLRPYAKKNMIREKEKFFAARQKAFNQIKEWARDGRLIIKDANCGTTISTADTLIRQAKAKYPDRHIIYICDNLYNLTDYAHFEDERKRVTERVNDLKLRILQKYGAMGLCTIEYKKGEMSSKSSNQALNEMLKESKSLEFRANWIKRSTWSAMTSDKSGELLESLKAMIATTQREIAIVNAA